MILESLAARTLGATFPYLLAGALSLSAITGGLAYFHGKSVVQAKWDKQSSDINAEAARARAKEVTDAMAVSLDIAGILRDGFATLATHKARGRAIAQEVATHVDATPALAAAVMPPDVVRLRREQSEESARIAAELGNDQGE